MIRRDAKTSGGESTWVLISQIEHARVSGELARHWGVDQISQLQPYDVVFVPQGRHHRFLNRGPGVMRFVWAYPQPVVERIYVET